ncbi:DUF1634 domain-containing protein [Pediococcus inopinatus]|uniref:DUF1634 domain-containing protein n=1 Tax=Pediococcus inopinatus TaxID=114090 RepID=A0ABZ0Q5X5_9LACO|nr:DUF1634 domain-containing protein [Pediococcus inopinatus]AVL00647.1 hypothetical protein PI20285_08370 [Pediococcus inopinatus]KRN63142.1 membrane protein [Pediococcus inopinatus]WPC17041.1 DUF1634 domain-containing protein [Pediococcus inopinatus]WPC19838.1 DUF1634 domain-containing protein [Pediococcus inopinatus]WPC21538.1 DUF1634 domain-containing protein [Pediococcus inopinatus]
MAQNKKENLAENTKKIEEMNQIELVIGQVLRVGVVISAIVILIGILLLVFTGKTGYAANVYPITVKAILTGIVALKPFAILMLGLFLLILTPVLRVVVSIYAFAKEKDQLYVWITTFVLVILIVGMVIGYFGK